MRRRIWSETLPFEELGGARVRGLLGRFGLTPIVAVRPSSVGLVDVVKRLRGDGLEVAVWPMLEDGEGRWASASNAVSYATLTRRVVDELARENASPSEVFIDLEPPFEHVRSWVAADAAEARRLMLDLAPRPFVEARATLTALVRELGERGLPTHAAFVPTILFDPPGKNAWQRALGTPVDGPAFATVSAMLYTSLFEGWSRGMVRRDDARALLGAAALAAVKRFGERASVSVGCVGTGAFGDEPVYRDPSELRDDLAIVAAAGVTERVLLDLAGVTRRERPEEWLEAFVAEPAPIALPPLTWRSRAAIEAAKLAGGALSVLTRFAPLGRA